MITELGRLNPAKLGVIARSSAMHYKNADRAIDRVRQELAVDYVVEGSVRRADNRVRITANLIQCSNQAQVWADSFERDLKDILALQSDVARSVAQEIKIKLTPQEQARMVEARAVNPEAYQAYLKGRFHWNKRTPDGLQKALEYFEQAIEQDPDWPLGYVGQADTYLLLPEYSSIPSKEAIPKARASAVQALAIDESLAEAHATMALIANNYDWNWPTAEREFQRALTLDPNYATAHHWYAEHLIFVGRHDEAIKEIANAQDIDPLSPAINGALGWVYYVAGDFAEAETRLRETLEFSPDSVVAHQDLAVVLFLQGRIAEAISEAQEAVRLSDSPYFDALLGYMSAKAGRPEEARKVLNELTARSTQQHIAPTSFALVYAALGNGDQVFDWLEKAFLDHDVFLLYALVDPLMADFRNDPRFADLVRRVGLPPLTPTDPSTIKPTP